MVVPAPFASSAAASRSPPIAAHNSRWRRCASSFAGRRSSLPALPSGSSSGLSARPVERKVAILSHRRDMPLPHVAHTAYGVSVKGCPPARHLPFITLAVTPPVAQGRWPDGRRKPRPFVRADRGGHPGQPTPLRALSGKTKTQGNRCLPSTDWHRHNSRHVRLSATVMASRFTPESGHVRCTSSCPLCANSGHQALEYLPHRCSVAHRITQPPQTVRRASPSHT